jgi:2-iminobutanoate/2-iminopropanoate deaminase
MSGTSRPTAGTDVRRGIAVAGLEHGTNPIPAASRKGPLLMTGGVRGVERASGVLPESAAEQTVLAFANLVTLVQAGGGTAEDIVHVTVFLADPAARAAVNEQWVSVFPDPDSRPARHVLTHELSGGMKVQLEATAFINEEDQG